ncbi:MAG: Tetracycline resistance efflux pump [Acidimicrobiales bacterium]|nr:Tetracycline resistance efflux pump [Acidimicrobiales bacterium]
MSARRRPLPPGFGTIWTSVALDLIGFGIVLPLLPQYAERFHASPATVGALFASFSVAQLVFAPVWGRLSDRIGRKPVLVLSLAGTAIGSLLTGLAGSLPLLFGGRIVDGMSGASVSVAHAAVADLAPPGERARLFGLLGAAFGLGFVAGPAIGALAALGDARLPFLIAAGIAGANAVVAVRRLPETNPTHTPPPPFFSGEEDRNGPVSATRTPGNVVGLLVIAFSSLVAFSAFEATFGLFGERRLGFHLSSTGAVFAGIGLVLALVQSTLVHPAVARLGEAGTLRLGLAINAVGLALLATVHSYWTLVPALLALVVGQGLAAPSLTAAFAGRARAERRGRALGVQQSANGLARVVGPIAGGLLFQRVGQQSPYLAGAVVMALCALALRPVREPAEA